MSIDEVQDLICASCGGNARRRDGMGRRRKLGTNNPDDILKLQVQRVPTLHDYSSAVTQHRRKLGRNTMGEIPKILEDGWRRSVPVHGCSDSVTAERCAAKSDRVRCA